MSKLSKNMPNLRGREWATSFLPNTPSSAGLALDESTADISSWLRNVQTKAEHSSRSHSYQDSDFGLELDESAEQIFRTRTEDRVGGMARTSGRSRVQPVFRWKSDDNDLAEAEELLQNWVNGKSSDRCANDGDVLSDLPLPGRDGGAADRDGGAAMKGKQAVIPQVSTKPRWASSVYSDEELLQSFDQPSHHRKQFPARRQPMPTARDRVPSHIEDVHEREASVANDGETRRQRAGPQAAPSYARPTSSYAHRNRAKDHERFGEREAPKPRRPERRDGAARGLFDPTPFMQLRQEHLKEKRIAREKERVEQQEKEEMETKKREEEQRRLEDYKKKCKDTLDAQKRLEDEVERMKEQVRRDTEELLEINESRRKRDQVEEEHRLAEEKLREIREQKEIAKQELEAKRMASILAEVRNAEMRHQRRAIKNAVNIWYGLIRKRAAAMKKSNVFFEIHLKQKIMTAWQSTARAIVVEREVKAYEEAIRHEQQRISRAERHCRANWLSKGMVQWRAYCALRAQRMALRRQHVMRKQQMQQFLQAQEQYAQAQVEALPDTEERSPYAMQNVDRTCEISNVSNVSFGVSSASESEMLPQQADANTSDRDTSLRENDCSQQHDAYANHQKRTPLYAQMEQRAQERKNRREELRLRYQEAEVRRKQQQKEEEERQRQEAIAEKKARIEARKEAERRAREQEEEKEERKRRMTSLMAFAGQQNTFRCAKFYGLRPWCRLIQMMRQKAEFAVQHYNQSLERKFLGRWKAAVVTAQRIREQEERRLLGRAKRHADCEALKRGMFAFAEVWRRYLSGVAWLDQRYRERTLRRVVPFWRGVVADLQAVRLVVEYKNTNNAVKHFNERARRRVIASWRRFVRVNQDDKEREQRKNEMWNKVNSWLTDYRKTRPNPVETSTTFSNIDVEVDTHSIQLKSSIRWDDTN